MENKLFVILTLMCVMLFTSCQKAVLDDVKETQEEGLNNVTFNIRQFEQIPFDKAKKTRATEIKDLCSNISVAAYTGSDLAKENNQKSTASNFGKVSLALDEGTYQVAIIANNGNKPTMKNPEQIKFSGGLSDTFFWSQEITVEDGQEQSVDVDLHRAVAMVRFVTTDSVPDSLATIKFYYRGGSSYVGAYTGKGYKKSTSQTSTISINSSQKGKPTTFEIYTFPKEETGTTLKIDVTGLNANKKQIFKQTFENVPVTRNQITVFKGKLFVEGGSSGNNDGSNNNTFTVTTSDEWTTDEIDF